MAATQTPGEAGKRWFKGNSRCYEATFMSVGGGRIDFHIYQNSVYTACPSYFLNWTVITTRKITFTDRYFSGCAYERFLRLEIQRLRGPQSWLICQEL